MKIYLLKTAFLMAICFAVLLNVYAGEHKASVVIKTTAQCDMCKARIEKHLSKVDGIIKSNLEVKTAECTVEYDSTKTNPDAIREQISSVGYDADNVKAVKRAYNKLPKCCKLPEDQ